MNNTMTRRIFRSTLLVGVVVLLAALALVMGVLYSYFGRVQESQLRDELSLAAVGVTQSGEDYLRQLKSDQYRITWVAADGSVLFDTQADASAMENHAQRQEVRQALAYGEDKVIADELAKYGRDVNGDGKILVNVDAIFMGGSDQISIVNQQKLVTRLAAGDELFYIMDPKSYEEKIVNNLEAEGAVFFDKLDLEAEGVSENGLYWNWKGSDLQKHELLQNAPEDLYFGVRALYGSADSGKNDEKHDDCMALLKALITDTPLSSSEDGGN